MKHRWMLDITRAASPARRPSARHWASGFAGEVTVHGIEILRLPSGAPVINVTGGVRAAADALGVTQWFVSITYSGGLALASVIAVAN